MTVAALAATGLAALGAVPASANPGNSSGASGYERAFTTTTSYNFQDVAVDSYTAQAFYSGSGVVDIIDEFSGESRGTVPFPGALTLLVDVDATRGFAWVLDPSNHALVRIDERTNSKTKTVTLAGDLRDLAVDHATGTVFVTTGTTGTVIPVDEQTGTAGTAIPVSGTANRIAVDASAGTLYVTTPPGPVALIDEATATVTGSVAGPYNAVAITVDAAHHKAYLGHADTSEVTVIDGSAQTATTLTVPAGYGTGITALGIDPSTQTVFAKNGAQLVRIDTETSAVSHWSDEGSYVVAPDIAVDVFSNTVLFSGGNTAFAFWEPISFLGSVSGVVPAGTPYEHHIDVWALSFDYPMDIAVVGGSLPPGLTLNGETIEGTATTPGSYTFSLKATAPDFQDSVTQTYTLRVVTVDRAASSDRFATSVEVSKASYPNPADVGTVYVANGISFPDALSGGPAASEDSGPLLLTAPGFLPASVSDEITRLHPAHIVVVGGPAVVGADVFTALQKLSPDVQRVYGGDRFGTSQAVIKNAFTTAPTVYVSTGLNFPDSLSAGGAAGSLHAPLLLVNGGATSVDAATASLLQSLKTTKIVVIGGSAVMSPSLVADFARFGTVVHLAGVDRWDSSQQVVETAFSASSRVILANGLNFPDALGASAWSGTSASPLFITLSYCVPQRTLDDTYFLGATKVTLVGGATVLDAGVAGLQSCGGLSVIAPTYPALAPVTGKKVTAFGSGSASSGQPVAPQLRVSPRSTGTTGR